MLPYDPETNLWKRGPGGSMYHSPPQAGGGGGFAGALKRKARGLSPLSGNHSVPIGGMITKYRVDVFSQKLGSCER